MLERQNPLITEMPASVYTEMNGNSAAPSEDNRAMQLAFELSLLGLEENGTSSPPAVENSPPPTLTIEEARKRSVNMTECVPVPSSEHVAEIVGRQGCKIKALRAKTNTYIKTPVRGEEPVFVVTGRKEDVGAAKREILSAAEHFSQIRASRRNSSVSSVSSSNGSTLTPGPPSPNAPGQVTIQVRVPYRVVGLVVGPKGATIKRIQQQTHTYIVTPSRDKEPVFEVTGLPDNVEKARQEIESHIAMRTGGLVDSQTPHVHEDDFHNNGIDSGFHELNGGGDLVGSVYSKSPTYNGTLNGNNFISRRHEATIFNFPPVNGTPKISEFAPPPLTNGFSGFNGFGIYDANNDEGIGSPTFDTIPPPPVLWPDMGDNHTALVSLFGSTPTTSSLPRRSSSLGASGPAPPLSIGLNDTPTSTSNMNGNGGSAAMNGNGSASPSPPGDHPMVRRIRSDPLSGGLAPFGTLPNGSAASCFVVTTSSSASVSSNIGNGLTENGIHGTLDATSAAEVAAEPAIVPNGTPGKPPAGRPRKNCLMCSESEVVAALVPCGHNLFCMECANLIVEKALSERFCPVCQQAPTQAIRIFSL